jgi:hypothetical protein
MSGDEAEPEYKLLRMEEAKDKFINMFMEKMSELKKGNDYEDSGIVHFGFNMIDRFLEKEDTTQNFQLILNFLEIFIVKINASEFEDDNSMFNHYKETIILWFMDELIEINKDEDVLDKDDVKWFSGLLYNVYLQKDYMNLSEIIKTMKYNSGVDITKLCEAKYYFVDGYGFLINYIRYSNESLRCFLYTRVGSFLNDKLKMNKDAMQFIISRLNSPIVLDWLKDCNNDYLFHLLCGFSSDGVASYTEEDVQRMVEGELLTIKYKHWAKEVNCLMEQTFHGCIMPIYTIPIRIGSIVNGKYKPKITNICGGYNKYIYPVIYIEGNPPTTYNFKSLPTLSFNSKIIDLNKKTVRGLMGITREISTGPEIQISIPIELIIKGDGLNDEYVKDALEYLNRNSDGSIVYLKDRTDNMLEIQKLQRDAKLIAIKQYNYENHQ